jgi:hypothetical protein
MPDRTTIINLTWVQVNIGLRPGTTHRSLANIDKGCDIEQTRHRGPQEVVLTG